MFNPAFFINSTTDQLLNIVARGEVMNIDDQLFVYEILRNRISCGEILSELGLSVFENLQNVVLKRRKHEQFHHLNVNASTSVAPRENTLVINNPITPPGQFSDTPTSSNYENYVLSPAEVYVNGVPIEADSQRHPYNFQSSSSDSRQEMNLQNYNQNTLNYINYKDAHPNKMACVTYENTLRARITKAVERNLEQVRVHKKNIEEQLLTALGKQAALMQQVGQDQRDTQTTQEEPSQAHSSPENNMYKNVQDCGTYENTLRARITKAVERNLEQVRVHKRNIEEQLLSALGKQAALMQQVGQGQRDTQTTQEEPSQTHSSPENNMYKNVQVISSEAHFFKKFGITGRRTTFTFKDLPVNNDNPIAFIQDGLDELLDGGLKGISAEDWVGVVFSSGNQKPVAVSFRKRHQLTVDVICNIVGTVMQSNETFFSREELTLQIDVVKTPVGYGRKTLNLSYEDFRKKDVGLLKIENSDNFCLSKALIVAMAYIDRLTDVDYERVSKNPNTLSRMAEKLCRDANVDLTNGGSYEHIQKFQDFLKNYTIYVYNSRDGKDIYFRGPQTSSRRKLLLYFENNHFDVITNLAKLFAISYYCDECRKTYSNRMTHKKCFAKCPSCLETPRCAGIKKFISCLKCRRSFLSTDCFVNHKKSLCAKLQRCKKCLITYEKNSKVKHDCEKKFCGTCYKIQPFGHMCFMQPIKTLKAKKLELETKFLFIFFDFETTQNTPYAIKPSQNLHVVNLCVSQTVCSACISNGDMNYCCTMCGVRQNVFQNNPVEEFLNYASSFSDRFNVTAIAHNLRAFDGIFVLNEMLKNPARFSPHVIKQGGKLLLISSGQLRFLDSLNFIPLPLAKLPATFKFSGEKGHFPYLFNTIENQSYVGPLPAPEFYGCDQMMPKDREVFFNWYNAEVSQNKTYIMKDEIVTYCIQDVNILRIACLKYRDIFIKTCDVDPFQEAITIASTCSLVYRKMFLKPDTLGIIPQKGYRLVDNQSVQALQWLFWLSKSTNLNIQHAGVGREVRLPCNLLVDGFCVETNTVYEYMGCYWHGCKYCFPHRLQDKVDKRSEAMFMKREQTDARINKILALGYNLEVMWECDFKKLKVTDKDLAQFIEVNKDMFLKNKLNPRDAFFGGRTNATKLYHKCTGKQVIKYYDFCSLYPFVNKYKKVPVSHPKIYVGDEQCRQLDFDREVEGLVKCEVHPPRNLFHPVLPYRCNNKLMFPLCRTCTETLFQGECTHTDEQRSLTGTWVSDELKKAVELGYKIVKFYEIWRYDVEIYDPVTKSGGVFTEYVNMFLKIKQENSGWPSWVKTDHDKDLYIKQYFEHEGILLDKDNITHNEGLRYISKLNLNSFWGKYGQRERLPVTTIVHDANTLYKHLNDPSIEVNSLVVINQESLLLTWSKIEEEVIPAKNTNVVIAAYTTANARLHLYKYLHKLKERAVYFDTDSIFFTKDEGEYEPPLGDYLGDFTDELECYGLGSFIGELASGGPKNYGFVAKNPKAQKEYVSCKVKGITLNYENSKIINFEAIRDMVCNNTSSLTICNKRKIDRTSTLDVVSRTETKTYRDTYCKRRRVGKYDTLPYGYSSK